jgi:NitT/TauT family transport system ATP-binding protein
MSGDRDAIRCEDVSCVFEHVSGQRVEALRGVTTAFPPGEFACIVGRSGHGKSTLLRAIAGLTPLTRGSIIVAGRPVTGPSDERGMVFQEDSVFPWMRVQENAEFGLKAQGVGTSERRRIADEWLTAVGLQDFADSWPRELSGGMRKRVAIATVFAGGAKILLMDEPFGALDYVTRLSLHDLVLDLWRRTRRTILFVTHDIEEALILGDRILVMRDGQIVDDLSVTLSRPRDEEVRARSEAVHLTKTIVRHLGLRQGPLAASDASSEEMTQQ